MRSFYPETKLYSLAILSILLVFVVSSCSLTRGLKDNQYLVRGVKVDSVDKEFSESALLYVDRLQQPNSWFNLQLYYLFNKKGNKDLGEAPAILDSNLVEFSRLQIQKYLRNKGYLKTQVISDIKTKNKKAYLTFTARQGPLFRIRNVQDSIGDTNVQALYRVNRRRFSHVQPGGRFDMDSLAYDRDEFYQVMKQNGYYDFYRQYMNYNYDTTFNNSVVDIKVMIDSPPGRKFHPIYKINNTLITIATSNGRTSGNADTLKVDSQFTFVDYSHRFKPDAVTRYIFQHKGDIYNIDQQTLTTSRLSELNVFRNVPNPIYFKVPDSVNRRLNTRIDIIPLKKMSDRVEVEFLHSSQGFLDFFSGSGYGFNVGNTFTHRNVFKHAEILQVKFNYSVLLGNSANQISRGGVQNQDFKIGVNLAFPRIIAPIDLPVLGKYGVPHTTLSSNFQLFYQNGLVKRRSFINSITYDWMETSRKQHSFTPISFEFSNGTIDPAARDALLKQNRFSYIYLIGRTVYTISTQYTYQLNFNKLNSLDDFVYFRGSLDIGGNTMSLLAKALNTPRDTTGARTLFGYPFAQYSKAEVDLRVYRTLGGERQFIFRINAGAGVPYGNSNQLIFEKNYYAGGANDMRAWLPRTLGPGQFNRDFYGSDTTTRDRLKYLDQFGEIKVVSNLEYRSKLINNFYGTKVKGALFMDVGNIWRIKDAPENPGGKFTFNNLYKSTAVGIGAGLRFDLQFFVFRLDAAFKFKDPQFEGADQYVLVRNFGELFKKGQFKSDYQDTHGEPYRFMQLNFAIGMPF